MHEIRLAGPLTFDSVVDGPGLRMVIWMQGCHHNCKDCHNPQTHDLTKGFTTTIEEIIKRYRSNPSQQGITISGGEPFLQSAALLALLRALSQYRKSIWLYSGYTFEELVDPNHPNYELHLRILGYLDVLVDGRFEVMNKDQSLLFRGSSNQRIIDIAKTSWYNEITLWDADK